ncbi:hypothetical protein HPB48_005300 [Haemaphysalis longicornis]|uniref:Uncharacterized protein n=1 Tax=Haemaphysalis longicornis TaxID=44386 RepID=A0A9J6GGQ4_HAELO|nr:hypothetical protein HPB48_005300 [Haemaphysalis longicornis]
MDAFKLEEHGALPSSTDESAKLSELGFGAAAEFGFFEVKKEGYEEKQACYFEPGDYKEYTPLPPYPADPLPSPGSPLAAPASPPVALLCALPESSGLANHAGLVKTPKQGEQRGDTGLANPVAPSCRVCRRSGTGRRGHRTRGVRNLHRFGLT